MIKTYRFYIATTVLLFLTPYAHAQDKRENNQLYFRKPSSIRPDKNTLDSLNIFQTPSKPNRLELIDKSSLLNLKNEKESFFTLPGDTSYYMRRITLLRMFHNPQSQKYGKEYNKMYRNNFPKSLQNYLKDVRPPVLYHGCLDPVEAINNYKKAQRAKKTAEVIGKLNALAEKDSVAVFSDTILIKKEVKNVQMIDSTLINKETPE